MAYCKSIIIGTEIVQKGYWGSFTYYLDSSKGDWYVYAGSTLWAYDCYAVDVDGEYFIEPFMGYLFLKPRGPAPSTIQVNGYTATIQKVSSILWKARDLSISVSSDEVDITTFYDTYTSPWVVNTQVLRQCSLSFTILELLSSPEGIDFEYLFNPQNPIGIYVDFEFDDYTAVGISGYFLITSETKDASPDSIVESSLDFVSVGAVACY